MITWPNDYLAQLARAPSPKPEKLTRSSSASSLSPASARDLPSPAADTSVLSRITSALQIGQNRGQHTGRATGGRCGDLAARRVLPRYRLRLRLPSNAKPTTPVATSTSVPGSGTKCS